MKMEMMVRLAMMVRLEMMARVRLTRCVGHKLS